MSKVVLITILAIGMTSMVHATVTSETMDDNSCKEEHCQRPSESENTCNDECETKKLGRESATLFAIGGRTQWDTYLSNERYKGVSVGIISEKSRPTHWFNQRVYVQHLTQGDLGYCDSRAERHSTISGMFHWQVAWQYHFLLNESRWELNAGLGLQTNLGFVYNTLGGNNPASARCSFHVIASGQAKRHFNLGRNHFTATLQADIPMSGMMFSPDYGQSYYEIFSLGKYSHNICYAFPLKAFQANTMISLDWNIKPTASVRIGYQGMFMQSKVNGLKTQDFSHHFIIGYVRRF